MCVSLGMFVSCPMMVEIGECNIQVCNFFSKFDAENNSFSF